MIRVPFQRERRTVGSCLYLVLDEVVAHSGADPAGLEEDLAEAGGRGRLAECPALLTEALTQQEVGGFLQPPLYGLTVSSFSCKGHNIEAESQEEIVDLLRGDIHRASCGL